MAEKKSVNKLLALLLVLVVLSLVVDLLSLNILYSISGASLNAEPTEQSANLEGELKSVSPAAQDCVNENCDTEDDCKDKGFAAMNACIADECWDPYNYKYKVPIDRYRECLEGCELEGEYEYEWCMIVRDRCIRDCINEFPLPPSRTVPRNPYIDSIIYSYYYETV